jgi:hypothetical protein
LPGSAVQLQEVLKREVVHLLSLPDHPHVVGITSVVLGASGTFLGYMMPVAELGNLQQVMCSTSQN